MKKHSFSILKTGLALLLCLGLYPAAQAAQESSEVFCELVDLGTIETSGDVDPSLLSADTGKVDLTAGNHVEWIDRIQIPDSVRKFYDKLVEASDGDGTDDFLIDDCYYVDDGTDNYFVTNGDTRYSRILACTVEREGEMPDAERRYIYDCIAAAWNAFDRDHPEVFWRNGGSSAIRYASHSGTHYTYNFYAILKQIPAAGSSAEAFDMRAEEFQSASGIRQAMRERDANVLKIKEATNSETLSSNYEKVKAFNKWLTNHNQYNTDLKNGPRDMRECISALEGRIGEQGPVCEGYARALKVLCDDAKIPCVLVDGQAGGGGHMWNYVQMEDKKWYGVDVTWNDPTVASATGAVSGYENENYLLVGADTVIGSQPFIESHPVANHPSSSADKVSFTNGPELSAEKYVHYVCDWELTYDSVPSSLQTGQKISGLSPILTGTDTNTKCRFAIINGTLPANLKLNSDTGIISGELVKATSSESTVTVQVSDLTDFQKKATVSITFPAVRKGENTITISNPLPDFYLDNDREKDGLYYIQDGKRSDFDEKAFSAGVKEGKVTFTYSMKENEGFDVGVPYDNGTWYVKAVSEDTENYTGTSYIFSITVTGNDITKLEVTTPPDKTVYLEGEYFDPTGMKITATYENSLQKVLKDYDIFPKPGSAPLSLELPFVEIRMEYISIEYSFTVKKFQPYVNPDNPKQVIISNPGKDITRFYAASYDTNGQMTDFAAGTYTTMDSSHIVQFSKEVSPDWFLFFLNEQYQPVKPKTSLSVTE